MLSVRSCLTTACALLTALGGAPAAFAHAYPQTETPSAGSTLQSAPTRVVIEFDDELEPDFSTLAVHDAHGNNMDDGKAAVSKNDPKNLSVAVKPLPPGTYRVIWHATDTDTHKTQGSFSFTIRP